LYRFCIIYDKINKQRNLHGLFEVDLPDWYINYTINDKKTCNGVGYVNRLKKKVPQGAQAPLLITNILFLSKKYEEYFAMHSMRQRNFKQWSRDDIIGCDALSLPNRGYKVIFTNDETIIIPLLESVVEQLF
jgi:hypothetical protein